MLAGLATVALHLFIATPASAATFGTNSFSDAFVTSGPGAVWVPPLATQR